jgi:hypothetical protein
VPATPAVATPGAPASPAVATQSPPAPAPSAPAAPSPSRDGDKTAAEQLYDRAAFRYGARDYTGAIQLTQQVLKEPSAGPRQKRNAWLLMGQAYCYLRHRAGAYRAWTELPQADRDDLRTYCQRASISLP